MDFNGKVVTARVSDVNDEDVFAQFEGQTLAIRRAEFDENDTPEVADEITGFAYEDEHHHNRLTRKMPNITETEYSFCEVVQVRRDLGVFVNVGLPDKDIVVSLDQLPVETRLWPSKGDKLMVRLSIDNKHRLWADLADVNLFEQLARKAKPEMKNQNVTATVFRLKLVGTFVITDEHQLGFIHPSERDVEPRLGEVVHGRVIGVRDDGELNISLHQRAYESIGDDAGMLVAIMERTQDGRMWLTDKSSPEDIKRQLDISKGSFKRAVGNLLKAGKIQFGDGYIQLKQEK